MVKVFGDPLHQREIHIKVNITMIKNVVKENIHGKKVHNILVHSKMI
jgi:hypothetical protein